MTFKVSFKSQLKSNTDLILIIMDESLELRDYISKLDKKFDGIISDAIKNKSLNKKGVQTEFIIKSDDFHFIKNFIKQNKKIDYELIQDSISTVEDLNIIKEKCIESKFLIIDHYEHNNTYYNFLKKNNIKWAQYDHGANKKIFSDVVINPNLGFSESDYKNLVSNKTIICAGNKYLLINKSIRKISNNNA